MHPIVYITFGFQLLCAVGLSYICQLPLWNLLFYLFVTENALYFVHRLGHSSVNNVQVIKYWKRYHGGHHEQYPPNKELGTSDYLLNVGDPYNWNTYAYLTVFASICLAVYVNEGLYFLFFFFVYCALNLLLEDKIHHIVHSKPPSTVSYTVWWHLSHICYEHHVLHHKYLYCNYAVVSLWLDALWGTYRYEKSEKLFVSENNLCK